MVKSLFTSHWTTRTQSCWTKHTHTEPLRWLTAVFDVRCEVSSHTPLYLSSMACFPPGPFDLLWRCSPFIQAISPSALLITTPPGPDYTKASAHTYACSHRAHRSIGCIVVAKPLWRPVALYCSYVSLHKDPRELRGLLTFLKQESCPTVLFFL